MAVVMVVNLACLVVLYALHRRHERRFYADTHTPRTPEAVAVRYESDLPPMVPGWDQPERW